MFADSISLLRDAVKQKGIGPKGSKKLPPEMLRQVLPLLSNPETNPVTAVALWTACLLLDNSEEEIKLLTPVLENPQKFLSPELQALTLENGSGDHNHQFPQDFLALLHKKI